MRANRSLRATGILAIGCVVASSAAGAPLLSWVATARITSGNSILTESPDPPAPGNDATTGFLEANGVDVMPAAPVDAGAIATYALSTGQLGSAAGFDAVSNFPIDGRLFGSFGGTSATVFDDVTVTSASLPNGTAVDVRFVFQLAFSAGAASSQANSNVNATSRMDVVSTAAGVSGLKADDNRYFDRTETGTFIQNGIFTGDHRAEYTIATTVGSTFAFAVAIDADAFGEVAYQFEANQTASGWSTLGLAFGGEVVGADAALASALLGGAPFPPASAVGPAQADAALPANPFDLPEPGLQAPVALATLLGLQRRRVRMSRKPAPENENDSR
ncbi:MAG: hypothetical protein QNK04_14075 [Myxococcota bacterium]|nr:hypothetical protein [Myxococcota bacterium]